jgi:hypothetical protein
MEDTVMNFVVDPIIAFGKDSILLLRKCNYPDQKGILVVE